MSSQRGQRKLCIYFGFIRVHIYKYRIYIYIELCRVKQGQNKTDMKRKATISVLMLTVQLSVLIFTVMSVIMFTVELSVHMFTVQLSVFMFAV